VSGDYTQLTVRLAAGDIDSAAAIAHMVVPYGFYIEDYSELESEIFAIAHTDLIDEELLNKNRGEGAIHLFISADENPAEAVAFLRERLGAAGIEHKITLADCRTEDWENNWKQFFLPTAVGGSILIVPEWLRGETAVPEGKTPLIIDPGLAFGTGGHTTTRLCLELLQEKIPKGAAVLDIGCGSGILGIAALLLGAQCVTGLDIDPVAVRSARDNAALNGFAEPQYTSLLGVLGDYPAQRQYELVLANIVADVLIPLAGQIPERLAADGCLLLSGIIAGREDEVLAAYAAQGLRICERRESDGWVALALSKGLDD
jgi:ribosomal protein L11 methyltransferase